MSQNVFVYGTLMYPQVLQTLLNRVPRNANATIHGYRRYAIEGQVFPAAIPSTADSKVEGVLLYDLTPEDMVVFNEFEGDEYFQEAVKPQLIDGSGSVDASVYIWQPSLYNFLRAEEWDPDAFAATYLESYVGMCTQFIGELREQEGRPQSRPLNFA